MRVFDHPNFHGGFACPICGTNEDKEVVLVAITGTQNGNIAEARQYHLACIELTVCTLPNGKAIVIQEYIPKEGS